MVNTIVMATPLQSHWRKNSALIIPHILQISLKITVQSKIDCVIRSQLAIYTVQYNIHIGMKWRALYNWIFTAYARADNIDSFVFFRRSLFSVVCNCCRISFDSSHQARIVSPCLSLSRQIVVSSMLFANTLHDFFQL